MESKPLVRWTAGPPKSRFDDAILRRSVANFKAIYGDRFDYVLCLNGRDGRDLASLEIEVLLQKPFPRAPEPKGCAWKLYPPRIRPNCHEIFIDHDLVLVDKINKVESFLSSGDAFIYSQSFSESGFYGVFRKDIPSGFRLNNGFFGLPPGFSFDMTRVSEWRTYFDDQGFVALNLCAQRNLIRVDLEEIWICVDERMPKNAQAYHFCNTNRDMAWLRFLKMTTI